MIQKCSTGLVGIEDSADGSAMLRSTLLVITAAHEDTGRAAKCLSAQTYVMFVLLWQTILTGLLDKS